MKTAARITFVTFIVLIAMPALGQSAGGQHHARSTGFRCSPAPCTLPPTQASEGGGMVTDAPIITNPIDHNDLLLGSFDVNCGYSSRVGIHLPIDGGSAWSRVLCMAPIEYDKIEYLTCDEPSVGYDAKGTAYVSGLYCGGTEEESYSLVGVQKSADGTHWSKPKVALALVEPGQSGPYLTHLSVDASSGSPWVGTVYVSGVMVSNQGNNNQVLV